MENQIQFTDEPAISSNGMLAAAADFGADFSNDRKYRYSLWRIWDKTKPLVMFVGLNPSTANETDNDPTIRSVGRIAKANGYGGFYMMNCWAYISTDPEKLREHRFNELICEWNDNMLTVIKAKCKDVVFAWGSFAIVRETGRDKELAEMFPNAKALFINKNGSPKHPLYCKSDVAVAANGLGLADVGGLELQMFKYSTNVK
jgi:hypothetical protein